MDYESDDNIITMLDEDGDEIEYHILASKQEDNSIYLLAETEVSNDEAEVIILMCNTSGNEDEDEDLMFELLEEDHEAFEQAFELFKEDLDALEIEY